VKNELLQHSGKMKIVQYQELPQNEKKYARYLPKLRSQFAILSIFPTSP